jgi:hypothetical protein
MKRRGQTLVVFALSLLLLVLMVTMTLGIGMRAKEKMELETVADATAYSNAVATARAFNSISLMNRALMGHMVAMTGVESLISWTSYYRATLNGAVNAYKEPYDEYALIAATNCPRPGPDAAALCRCANQAMRDIKDVQDKLKEEDDNIERRWDRLDRAAGLEARSLQITTIAEDQKALFRTLMADVGSTGLADKIVEQANGGGGRPMKALPAEKEGEEEENVNQRELNGDESCGGKGAACTRRDAGNKLHFVYAAMGSRGYSFVTGRGVVGPIRSKLQTFIPPPDAITTLTNEGSGYFPAEGQKTHSGPEIDATEVWADDHGDIGIQFNRGQTPCPVTLSGDDDPRAHVRSNHEGDSSDEHVWTGGRDSGDVKESHTMGTCTLCPGIWPPHMDYNYKLVSRGGDKWGQPKSYALIQRDYGSGKKDPWNLMFRFRFTPSREGVLFDNRGEELATDGTDISKALALSAGITYYKRAGRFWKEPPNFLNPFWRATLVPIHVDVQGEDDAGGVLSKASPFAGEVHKALVNKEYKGW